MQALVVVAHGSHLNPDSARPALDHTYRVRATGAFDEVRAAFWKEQPDLREVLRTLESDDVYVVPLFMAEGYFTEQVIPRELRLSGWEGWDSDGTDAEPVTLKAADTGQTVYYCGPVGTHDAMTDVIEERAETVTGDRDVGEGFGLAVVGHGTERNPRSAASTEYHVARIRERGRFEEVHALFMDEAPEVDDLTDYFEVEEIVLVPLFVADGYHTREDIPRDVGIADEDGDETGSYDVPAEVDGHRIWYAGAVGTEPLIANVLIEETREAGADIDPDLHVIDLGERPLIPPFSPGASPLGLGTSPFTLGASPSDLGTLQPDCSPHPGEAGRAFLDWLSDTDERTWGQLLIRNTSDSGTDRYELRHVADSDASADELDQYEHPRVIRELIRENDRGDYRPLAYAPTLPTGWRLADVGPGALLAAVEAVSPASVSNWHLEREGELDVTHWRSAAARHTGIYAVVEELPDEGVHALAEALCEGCVKRREWDLDETIPIDANRGDGEFPCREPCSLAIAAAREFLALEEELEELPVDCGEFRSLLEAAAGRRIEGIREGELDDPDNPYRARYVLSRGETIR